MKYKAVLTRCVEVSDPISAHVLYRLRYWVGKFPDKRDGKLWCANPRYWWCEQTGLKSAQFDRAITRLRKIGAIVVELHPHPKWAGMMSCRWIRFSDAAAKEFLAGVNSDPIKSDAPTTANAKSGLSYQEHSLYKESSKGKEIASPTKTSGTEVGLTSEEEAEAKTKIVGLALQHDAHLLENFWAELLSKKAGITAEPFTASDRHKATWFLVEMSEEQVVVADLLREVVGRWPEFMAAYKTVNQGTVSEIPHIANVVRYPKLTLQFYRAVIGEV